MSKFPSTDFNPAEPPTGAVVTGTVASAIKEADGKVVKADAGAAVILPLGEINTFPDLNVRVAGKTWQDRVDSLASDMKAKGYDSAKPLIVFALKEDVDGKPVEMVYVEDGHTRLAAAQKAGIENVPVIFRPSGWTPLDATKHMIRDNSGEPLSPWEQGVAVSRMKLAGMNEDQIASELGKTKRYVQDLLVLAEAPAPIRNAVLKGEIAAREAVKEIRAVGPEKAAATIEKALEKAKAAGKNKVTPSVLKGKEKATGKKPKAEKEPKKSKLVPAEQDGKLGDDEAASGVPDDAAFLRAAITYATNFGKAAEGIGFLKRLLAEEAAAATELEKFMGQPAGSYFDATLRTAEESLDDL